MDHPTSTERPPFSEWHRGGPERRIAGVSTALARELDVPLPAVRAALVLAAGLYLALWFVLPPAPGEPSALDRVVVAVEDLFSARRDRSKQER